MKRFLSSFFVLSLLASLAGPAFAKDRDRDSHGRFMKHEDNGRHIGRRCGPGRSWVRGYRTANGHYVKGYCRS